MWWGVDGERDREIRNMDFKHQSKNNLIALNQ